jgi:bacterioferritin (cytochrome b1)
MPDIKEELVKMLNTGLELEHSARIQYLTHAELIKGQCAEKIIERLKELAEDEEKHEAMFRNLVGSYLDAEPSMGMAKTYSVKDIKGILEQNLKQEKEAIGFYKKIYKKIIDNKDCDCLQYEFERLEHDVRHIIIDEQEHVVEISLLLG